MKRILNLLIITFVFAPMIVLADAAGPAILGYDAVITNKNGIKTDDGTTIKYNTKIYVVDEQGETLSFCLIENKNECFGNSFSTKASNVAPLKKELTPDDYKNSKNLEASLEKANNKIMVLNKKGIKLKKGPADAFGKYDTTIPYKTILKSTYYIRQFGPSDDGSWYYIDSDSYKGWVHIYSEEVGLHRGEEVVAFNNTTIYDDNNKEIGTLHRGDIVSNAFYYNEKYYIKYDDIEGYVISDEKFNFGVKSNKGYILTLDKIEIESNDGETVGYIPEGEKVKIIYSLDDDEYSDAPYHSTPSVYISGIGYYYVEYNGTKGFINDKKVQSLYYEYKEKTLELKEEKDFYNYSLFNDSPKSTDTFKLFLSRHKTNGKIPKSASIKVYSIYSHYDDVEVLDVQLVVYKGKVGCITDIRKRDDVSDEPVVTSEPATIPPVTATPNTNNNSNNGSSSNIVLYSIIAAVLLSITAILTIIVVNKKKKNKKDDKEEKKENISEKKVETPKEENKEENKTEEQNAEKKSS